MAVEQELKSSTYKTVSINGKQKRYSHYVWFVNTGHWPDWETKREIVHHKDGNPLNNDFSNLLLMTAAEHNAYCNDKRRLLKEKGKSHKIIVIDGEEKLYSHYIYFLNTGYWPDWKNKREVIHHKDGNSLNNDFSNLQLMTAAEHSFLHNVGKKNPMYGVKYSEEAKRRMSEATKGEDNPRWLGDSASANAKYERHRKHPKLYPPLTDEERKEYNTYKRNQERNRK